MKEKITPIEYLKSHLGVVDGEEFDVYRDGIKKNIRPYYFEQGKLTIKGNVNEIFTNLIVLKSLLNGEYTIKKRPFVPKEDEKIFYISKKGYICETMNLQWIHDIAIIKLGWTFRTREEAEANKERVMREMKEVMGE